jgi:hypothetical protein
MGKVMTEFSGTDAKRILETYGSVHHKIVRDTGSIIEGWCVMNSFGRAVGGVYFAHKNHHIMLDEMKRRLWFHVEQVGMGL